MAQVAGPQGPEQYLADAAASAFARTQSPGKHLAVHAPQLAVKPHLQILRRYRRSLLLCLEYADRPTLEDHVHCSARLGNRASGVVRIGISRRTPNRHPPRVSPATQIKVAAAPRAVREIAWKAQMRLCGRFRSLTRKGKRPTVVATAIPRELSPFIWPINPDFVGSHPHPNHTTASFSPPSHQALHRPPPPP